MRESGMCLLTISLNRKGNDMNDFWHDNVSVLFKWVVFSDEQMSTG